jgi:hypothetical protein
MVNIDIGGQGDFSDVTPVFFGKDNAVCDFKGIGFTSSSHECGGRNVFFIKDEESRESAVAIAPNRVLLGVK